MKSTRFALLAALVLLCSASAMATQWVTVTVTHQGKPVYNAAVTITDTEPPPESYLGYTKVDGTYRFAIWPNAKGEICIYARTRQAPVLQSSRFCMAHPYEMSVDLPLH